MRPRNGKGRQKEPPLEKRNGLVDIQNSMRQRDQQKNPKKQKTEEEKKCTAGGSVKVQTDGLPTPETPRSKDMWKKARNGSQAQGDNGSIIARIT